MTILKSVTIKPDHGLWPKTLTERLGDSAPTALQAIGPVALLAVRRNALFCSARTPGDAILRAHDAARRMRDAGVTVIRIPLADREALPAHPPAWQAADHHLSRPRH